MKKIFQIDFEKTSVEDVPALIKAMIDEVEKKETKNDERKKRNGDAGQDLGI